MAKITCVGCGMMGSNLVEAFMNKGNQVHIVDINEQATLKYVKKGAKYSANVKDALDCDFIILSLPNDKIVKRAFDSVEDLNSKVVVNTSSEVPSEVIDIQKYFTDKNARYLDATILTYQGDVGTKYGYLLYSGPKDIFDEIQESLKALSDPAVYVGDSIVASEIVDLIAITAHFGITYSPLECLCLLEKYNYKLDDYLNDLDEVLSVLANQKDEKDDICQNFDYDQLLEYTEQRLKEERIYDKLNEDWLDQENKSLSNHYKKIISIEKSNYEY